MAGAPGEGGNGARRNDDDVVFSSPISLPPTAHYSHSVVIPAQARMLFISGQVALDASGKLLGAGDFRAQAEAVFANIGLALADAGTDFHHLVKLGMYLTDMAHLPVLRQVRDRYIDLDSPPTSTLLGVSGFFHPDILVEIDAVAVIPS